MATEEIPKLHFLVEKQLARLHLDESTLPVNPEDWKKLLARISRAYLDHEQERYLLERSMEISSREMMELNDKLEFAQHIAHLGYWFYDRKEDKVAWSKETYLLAGIDPAEGVPSLQEILAAVHEEDRQKLVKLMDRAFAEGKDYEIELRYKNKKDGHYHWHYAKGHPHSNPENKDEAGSLPLRYLSGVAIDITDRKEAEEKVKSIHQQLLSISRQAGMAEVATSVLHNIGNILNSANVSISAVLEMIANSHVDKLVKIAELVKEHLGKKDDFLTNDESGKLIPEYLLQLSKTISNEYSEFLTEINQVSTHLSHIKDIVSLQKDISGIVGIKETIPLIEILDLAVQMGCTTEDRKIIEITKDYHYDGTIMTEKAKLLQILVNLIRNARDSVMSSSITPKKIKMITRLINQESAIEIALIDNGEGIIQDNLTRIFSLGFTTKPKGHGFGLHSSAIAATELKGSLKVESQGAGQGAVFKVTLPIGKESATDEDSSLT